jgi:acyl CoA:acetate/3-ketoacid CoA transferase alpha subunit
VEEGAIPIRYHENGVSGGVKIPGTKKEFRELNGRRCVLERAIAGDVAFVRAWKVDEVGNTVFRFAPYRNSHFHPLKLSAGILRTISTPSWQRMQN